MFWTEQIRIIGPRDREVIDIPSIPDPIDNEVLTIRSSEPVFRGEGSGSSLSPPRWRDPSSLPPLLPLPPTARSAHRWAHEGPRRDLFCFESAAAFRLSSAVHRNDRLTQWPRLPAERCSTPSGPRDPGPTFCI